MKKLAIVLGLALAIGTAGVAKVQAGTYGTDITIYDNAVGPTSGWWNQGSSPGEDQETEYNPTTGQGTQTGQQWDLEAFQQKKNILSIIGGFNFPTGVTQGDKLYTEPLGALFLRTGVAPPYGVGNTGGTGTALNSIWGYDYAITFAFNAASTGGTYTVWTPGDNAAVQLHNTDGDTVGNVSNPLTIVEGTWNTLTTGTFTYTSGLTDAQLGNEYLGGDHNVISGIDLSFLVTDPNLGNPLTFLHLTYGCGNDNLMGEIAASSVPIPPSALLLGTGLLGLAGLGWRRRRQSS
jgi:MYXO-CTERM domain-containing protein